MNVEQEEKWLRWGMKGKIKVVDSGDWREEKNQQRLFTVGSSI
jgi:hypothetical protein